MRYFNCNAVIGKNWQNARDFSHAADLIRHMDSLGVDRSLVYHEYAQSGSTMGGNRELLAEIDLDSLVPFRSRTNCFEHIAEFPENTFDISFLVDGSVKWDEMKSAILGKKAEGSLLKDVLFVDEYRGRQIPDGKKSVTVRLVIGSNEKTLTGAEIESVADSVMRKIAHVMGAEVRSK